MSRNQRIAVLVAAVAVLVVGFVIAQSSSDENDDSPTTATTQAADTQEQAEPDTTTTTTTTTTKPAAPAVPTVVVRDGKPVGGVKKLEFSKDDTIAFNVRSDVADEVHFHGYDVSRDVAPGEVAKMRVKATIEGRFEVELEQRGVQIAQVEVNP